MYLEYTWIPRISLGHTESPDLARPLPVGSSGNLKLRSFVDYLEYTWAA